MADLETAHATLDHDGVTGVLSNPMTTQDDIIVGGASGVAGRLAKGTDGQVLTVDPTTHHLLWATPSSGFSDPMTTRGDIIYRNSGNTTTRLGRGSAGQVLTSDGTDLSWQTPSGGGINRYFPLDRATLDGTYGDEFDGASLNGRWSRHVQTSGEETYQVGGIASALRVAYSTGAASRYIYQTAPNGTNETWECCVAVRQTATSGEMFCLLMVDSSGNGVAVMAYNNARILLLANVTSHAYASSGAELAYPALWYESGQRMYLRLRKASGVYSGTLSVNGETYLPEVSFTPSAFTPARVGVGRILGTQANDLLDINWFDKTA